MPGAETWLAGPAGPFAAIILMAAVTYGLRVAGVLIMGRIRITPAVERGLAALPGSIVAATVLPIAIGSGAPAIGGVLVAVAAARFFRNELLALGCAMAFAAGARALGF